MRLTAPARSTRRAIAALGCVAALGTTSACGASDGAENDNGSGGDAKKVSVKHAQGTASVPLNPKKVVVVDHAAADSLVALGITPAGAVTDTAPPHLTKAYGSKVTSVGSLHEPDIDAIAEMQPDAIIIGPRAAKSYKKLNEIAPTIDVSTKKTSMIAALKDANDPLGTMFGKSAEVTSKINAVQSTINRLKTRVPAGDTALVVMVSGGKLSAFGTDSRFGTIHSDLGFTPAEKKLKKDRHGQVISFEFIKEKNPDWMFVIDRDAAIGDKGTPAKQVLDNAVVKSTTAAKKNQVVYLDGKRWYAMGGGLDNAAQMYAPIEAALPKK